MPAPPGAPALERPLGTRLAHAGVSDLLAKYPSPSALRTAGKAKIARTVKAPSPRLAAKVTDEVLAPLDAHARRRRNVILAMLRTRQAFEPPLCQDLLRHPVAANH